MIVLSNNDIINDNSSVKIVFGKRRSGKTTVIHQFLNEYVGRQPVVVVVPFESVKREYRQNNYQQLTLISVSEFVRRRGSSSNSDTIFLFDEFLLYSRIDEFIIPDNSFDKIVLTGTPDSQVLFNPGYENNLDFLKSIIKRFANKVSLFELTRGELHEGEEDIYMTVLRDIDQAIRDGVEESGICFSKFELILGDDYE